MHYMTERYGGSDGDMFQDGYDHAINNQGVIIQVSDLYWAQGYCAGLWEIQQEIDY